MRSQLTTWALQLNAKIIAEGGGLTVTRAIGVDESGGEALAFSAYETPVREGTKYTIPLYYKNAHVPQSFYISRIEVYAKDGETEGLYAFADLAAPQGVSAGASIELFYNFTTEIVEAAEEVTVVFESVSFLTREKADELYALTAHRHPAHEIDEDTGETVEQSQRRQDALLEQIMAYIGSASVTWLFPGDWIIERGVVKDGAISTGGAH